MRRGDEEGRPTGGEGVGVSRALEEIVGEVPRDAYGAGEGGKLEWHGAVVEVGAVAVPGAEIGMARVEVGSIEGEDAVQVVAEVQDVRVRAREGGVDVGVIARHRHLLGGAVAAEPAELGAALAILGEVRAESGNDHREGGDAKLAAEAREGELGAVHAGNGERRAGCRGGGRRRARPRGRARRARDAPPPRGTGAAPTRRRRRQPRREHPPRTRGARAQPSRRDPPSRRLCSTRGARPSDTSAGRYDARGSRPPR